MKKTSKRGFTLVELMITVALLAAVGALCSSLVIISMNHSRQSAQKSAFQIGVNKLISVMNSRINSGEDGSIEVEVTDASVTIKVVDKVASASGVKKYKIEETYSFDSNEKAIYISDGSGQSVLSPYVGDVVFDYDQTKHLVRVSVKSDLDGGWLDTSFYIRQIMSDEKSAA